MTIYKYILLFALFIPLYFSCTTDVLKNGIVKNTTTTTTTTTTIPLIITTTTTTTVETVIVVGDFLASAGIDNREVVLTWTKPTASFDKVLIKRGTDQIPTSATDNTFTTVYESTGERYTDSRLTPGYTYYYTAFVYANGKYYQASYASKQVTETISDIRMRSFFIIGGTSVYSGSPQTGVVAAVDMFDPLTETYYQNVTTMPTPRYFCDVASVKGKIYVFGGLNSSAASVTTVDMLDVATLTWTSSVTTMHGASAVRNGLRVVAWNDKIYTMHGSSTTLSSGVVTPPDGRRYDPVANTWLANDEFVYKDLTGPRVNFAAEVYDGTIYYFGGNNGTAVVSTGYYYNILTNSEVAIGGLPTALIGATSAIYHKELDTGEQITLFFYIGGGTYSAGGWTPLPITSMTFATDSIYMLNLPYYNSTPTFLQLTGPAGTLNVNRAYAGAESYGDYVYVFGGVSSGVLSSIERLNVNNGYPTAAWSVLTPALSPARYAFGITNVNN